VIALSEFPPESHPLMLAALGSLPLPYRFYVRLEHYDPTTANVKLAGYTRSWGNRLYGPLDALHRMLGGIPRENPHAAAMLEDVRAAQAENDHGDYRPVGYTAGFVLIGEDATKVDTYARLILREVRYRGYGARDETLNCADGYFGSMVANGSFNPRRAIINTLNAAHTLCLDIPWGGQESNPSPYYPPNSPPMLIGLTRGNAPFGYCDHVDDRGHVLMPGPTPEAARRLQSVTRRCCITEFRVRSRSTSTAAMGCTSRRSRWAGCITTSARMRPASSPCAILIRRKNESSRTAG